MAVEIKACGNCIQYRKMYFVHNMPFSTSGYGKLGNNY